MVLGGLSLQKFLGAFLRGDFDALRYAATAQNHRNAGNCYAELIGKLTNRSGMTLQNLPDSRLAQLRLARVCFSLS